jgi:16S rRNA (adenine1518-N6/adenine1519-N6)-dimethyltransferase
MQKLLSLEDTIKKHQLHPNKKLGQHFLTDSQLLNQIVRYGGDLQEANVIEIGAGPGGLTRALLASPAKSVTVIELDERAIPALYELQFHYEKLHIVEGDATKYDIRQVPTPRAIIANLPYNVGTPLVVGWLKMLHAHGATELESITVMLQQEVAMRISATANDDDYGRLSVLCNWLCDIEICMDVPPSAFTPPPKVMSSVVRLTPKAQPAFAATFVEVEKFLGAAFGQRRKMLRGALKNWCENPTELLETIGIDSTRRAETLTLAEIGRLIAAKHYKH